MSHNSTTTHCCCYFDFVDYKEDVIEVQLQFNGFNKNKMAKLFFYSDENPLQLKTAIP